MSKTTKDGLIDEAAVRAEIAALCATADGTRRDGRTGDPRRRSSRS